MTHRVCLIEDDPIMGESLDQRFKLEGYAVLWVRSLAEAETALTEWRPDVVVSDIRLPDGDASTLFERSAPLPPVVFMTAYASVEGAVTLLKQGASDYLVKPFRIDELIEKIESVLPAPVDAGKRSTRAPADHGLGVSPAIQRLAERAARIAAAGVDALILGESGVGKEYLAQYLHRMAGRADERPFIAVNCGAFTESLLEAELFGHVPGAFTGAHRGRRGVFEQAHGGTLFLDELGEMSQAMQVRLLRVLQERAVRRLGSEEPVPVNVTLVAATNRDLPAMVREGSFREDLYYRVNTVQLHLPPLRERPEDILHFADQFLAEAAARVGGPAVMRPDARRALVDRPWHGNLRELQHAIERACILSDHDEITLADLEAPGDPNGETGSQPAGLSSYLKRCERTHIQDALVRNEGRIAETAQELGISRKNLWEKMRRHEITAAPPLCGNDD